MQDLKNLATRCRANQMKAAMKFILICSPTTNMLCFINGFCL